MSKRGRKRRDRRKNGANHGARRRPLRVGAGRPQAPRGRRAFCIPACAPVCPRACGWPEDIVIERSARG